jgi:hypothetical protein
MTDSVQPPSGTGDAGRDAFPELKRWIGIGAVLASQPLPHHRANGSVHGGSVGYVVGHGL